MRKYLSSLRTRSEHHQKNFALVVSGAVTLMIFAGWLMVRTADRGEVVADANVNLLASASEVGPFESLSQSFSEAWTSLKSGWSVMGESFGELNIRSGYDELREESSVNTYGN